MRRRGGAGRLMTGLAKAWLAELNDLSELITDPDVPAAVLCEMAGAAPRRRRSTARSYQKCWNLLIRRGYGRSRRTRRDGAWDGARVPGG